MLRAHTRRTFLKRMMAMAGALAFRRSAAAGGPDIQKATLNPTCKIFRAVNGKPDQNMAKVIELMGGIENLIGRNDIVVIKPNVQWWNQGAPNLRVMKTLVDLIFVRPGGFVGEVIIGENCHRGATPSKSAGWTKGFSLNSDLPSIHNYNDLGRALKKRYGDRFSTVHWVDVDAGQQRVFSPADGSGYVYCDGTKGVPLLSLDNGQEGEKKRSVIMTYPIFKTDQGTIVDFKNGIWEKGAYTDQPLRFINFAALNHHSTYCGATSAIKNYLGISDLSGGPDPHEGGKLTQDYFNFHSFPFDKWAPGPSPGMIGAEIGVFMNTIRKADLNVTTAEWIGLADRTEHPVAHTRAVLASEDPVALDYHSTKYLLFPNSRVPVHNPDNSGSPLHQYLRKCAEVSGCAFDEAEVEVRSWDFKSGGFQSERDLVHRAKRHWGNDPKSLAKYAALRWFL